MKDTSAKHSEQHQIAAQPPVVSRLGRRAFLCRLSAVAAAAAGLAMAWRRGVEEWYSPDAARREVEELLRADRILALGEIPKAWDVATFVSTGSLTGLLQALEGVTVRAPKLQGVELTIRKIGLSPDAGMTRAAIDIEAHDRAENIALCLRVNAIFQYKGTFSAARDGDIGTDTVARFGFTAASIKPVLKLLGLSGSAGDLAGRLIGEGVVRMFSDSLQVDVPLTKNGIKVGVGFKEPETRKLPTDDGRGSVTLQASMPFNELKLPVTLIAPLSTPKGFFLLASSKHALPLPDKYAELIAASIDREPELRRELRGKVMRALDRIAVPTDRIAIWINAAPLAEHIAGQYNSLSDRDRTLTLKSVARTGHLKEDMHKADIVGEGGYRIDLVDDAAATAVARFSKASAEWKDGRLWLTAGASADAEARLKVHVDPYVGGGFSFGATIRGGLAAFRHSESLVVDRFETSHGQVLVAGTAPKRTEIELTLLTGGDVKIGARTYHFLGDKAGAPDMIVDPLPRYQALSELVGKDAVVEGPAYLQRIVKVDAFSADADGYSLILETRFDRVSEMPTEADRKALLSGITIAVGEAWHRRYDPPPAKPRATVFLFAGQEFGPNNELVKIFKQIGEFADRTKHNAEVAWEDISRIARNPLKAPEVIHDVLGRTARETERAVQNIATGAEKVRDWVGKRLGL
jgi:hypothetical protein